MPSAPGYLKLAEGVDVFEAFNQHVAHMVEEWASDTDPNAISLLAAARVLTGDLSAATLVIDHFPEAPAKLDHGAGVCLVAPLLALHAALPLPADLTDTRRWLARSPEQAALRAWIAEHRHSLHWDERAGVYVS